MNADELLARDLSAALAEDRIQPYFQPIVALDSGRTLGLEVLARWNDPVRGEVNPSDFIPLADRDGLLDDLLERLMRRAFASARDWPQHLFLGFNVSPAQLHDRGLATRIADIATAWSFPLTRVHIEVTESGVIDDLADSKRTLERLIDLGCMIAMDDFGTGYSSLTWLSSLPFSKIKIDRRFVAAVTTHRQSRKIVSAVVGLGHSLGLAVVAEGVENAAQAELLRGMGCKLAQGFLFGRPMPSSLVSQHMAEDSGLNKYTRGAVATSLEVLAKELSELHDCDDAVIAYIDLGGRIVATTAGFVSIMNADRRCVNGRPIWEFVAVTPETLAEVRAIDLLGESFAPFEEVVPEGSRMLVSIRTVKDENHALLGYCVECVDPKGCV